MSPVDQIQMKSEGEKADRVWQCSIRCTGGDGRWIWAIKRTARNCVWRC